MTIIPREGHPFTGWHMLAVVGLFFGTIIAVNIAMAYWAVSTFPGLNAHNSYVASQNYNLLLKAAANQDAIGWRGEVSVSGGHLGLQLTTREGSPVKGLEVSALTGRPASAADDRDVPLLPQGDSYRTEAPLAPGRWLVEIEAREKGELRWRETRAITVE